jgi:hypothetical protein
MVYCQLFASAFRDIDRCDVAGMDRGQDRRSDNGIFLMPEQYGHVKLIAKSPKAKQISMANKSAQ